MTTPTRDRVRETREAIRLDETMSTPADLDAFQRAVEDALLDALDADVAALVSPEDDLFAAQNRFLAPDTMMAREVAQDIASRLTMQRDEPIALTQGHVYSLLSQIRRERLKLYTDTRAAIRARKEAR